MGFDTSTIGESPRGTERLDEAVAAYRAALQEWTRDGEPLQWAQTQSNLGTALRTLGMHEITTVGEHVRGTTRLVEAVDAYRAALREWTRERSPLLWAQTQNNLGNVLTILGEPDDGTARLDEAVLAYRAALQEWTRERKPQDWARTQLNLGNALFFLGVRGMGTVQLEQAIVAFRASLEETARKTAPLDWAQIQDDLGDALATLGTRKRSAQLIFDGKMAVQSAWDTYKAAGQHQYDKSFAQDLADFDEAIRKLGALTSNPLAFNENRRTGNAISKEEVCKFSILSW